MASAIVPKEIYEKMTQQEKDDLFILQTSGFPDLDESGKALTIFMSYSSMKKLQDYAEEMKQKYKEE
jgi:hypothetical protein